MQTMHPGQKPEQAGCSSLMLFRLGGRRLAARTEELAGIQLWGANIRIPSRTPYVDRLLRQGDEVLPVYDLGARMKLQPVGATPLCLIARHHKGRLAVCIDADLPTLHPMPEVMIDPSVPRETDVLGTVQIGTEAVPILSLSLLGVSSRIGSLEC